MNIWWAVLAGVVIFVAGWLSVPAVTALLAWRKHRRFSKHVEKTALPKGTRPDVKLIYDGVTYDLTDGLRRAEDEDGTGYAVWVVLGPAHLRMTEPPDISIGLPLPRHTHVKLSMQGSPQDSRFSTLDEINKEYTLID